MGELKLVDVTCEARAAESSRGQGKAPLQVQLWTGRDNAPLE